MWSVCHEDAHSDRCDGTLLIDSELVTSYKGLKDCCNVNERRMSMAETHNFRRKLYFTVRRDFYRVPLGPNRAMSSAVSPAFVVVSFCKL